jgi:hypothetical protein
MPLQSNPLPPGPCLISDHHTCKTAIPPQSNPLPPCPCLISDHHTCTTAMPTVMDATTMRLFSIHFCPEGIQPAVYILVSLSKSYKTNI